MPSDDEIQEVIENEINKYIQGSFVIAGLSKGYLNIAIKASWFDEDKRKNKDSKKNFHNYKSVEISRSFFNKTENKFYELLKVLCENAEQLADENLINLRALWYKHIKVEALKLFDRWAFKSSIQTNPKRIAKAYNELKANLNGQALKRDVLGLP